MINEQTKSLLLQVAGFLRLIEHGIIPSHVEVMELQDKIGALIKKDDVP